MPPKDVSKPDASIPTISDENPHSTSNVSLEDQTLLLIARLMEGGLEDEESIQALDELTHLITHNAPSKSSVPQGTSKPNVQLHQSIDLDGFETILGFLDMRQSQVVRGHAILTTSAYFKASEEKGAEYLSKFFESRVSKGTYDDLILAFSVAASVFPIVPEVSANLFLTEGFVKTLGPLMKRKWKSRKVGQAALEMLNAACMNTACREAIQKYCTEWLEEVVTEKPRRGSDMTSPDRHAVMEDGIMQQRYHSENVRTLAAVVLAKLQVG